MFIFFCVVNNRVMLIFPVLMGNACVKNNCTAISTINEKGKINVVGYRDKFSYENITLPFFRGIAYFLFGFYLFFKNLLMASSIDEVENKNINKSKFSSNWFILALSIFIGFVLGYLGFVLLPYLCFNNLARNGFGYGLICFVSALVRLAMLTLILATLRFIPAFKQFYRHNASANLAIKEHYGDKSGNYHLSTNFLTFVISCFYILFFVLSFTALDINLGLKILLNIAITLFVVSIVYEFLKIFEKQNNVLCTIFVKPISCLVTVKPSLTEKNIAQSVIEEAQMMEENSERILDELSGKEIPMSVVISEVKEKLKNAGIEASSEAEWLIAECLNKNRNEIRLQTTVSKEEYKKINNATTKREKHIPLTKIFNKACFYGYDFYIDKNVLSPRPETEILVEEVIKEVNKNENSKLKILDLCTGSGAIAVVLSKKTDAKIFASDISELALNVAKRNAQDYNCNIKFIVSDMFKNFKKEKFDIIVSNPPYIPTKDILALEDEVKNNDPLISLDGGEDGLYFYREIIKNAPNFLNKNGKIFLEIGINQSKSVKKLLQNDFENIKIIKDYSGIDRIIVAKLKGKT